jgi:hypothetical protein
MKKIILATIIFLTSCAGTRLNYLPNPIPAQQMRKNPQDIEIMYDGPGRPYDVLGLLDCSRYQPGFSDPSLVEVLPEIKFKASQVGGDGVIIRRNSSSNRNIEVAAEVIRYRE